MLIRDSRPSFTGGEVSPLVYGRVDLQKYGVSARECMNMIILPQGGVCNRPGTYVYNDEIYDRVRLVDFVYNDEQSFILVFTNGGIDVYDRTSRVFRLTGSPYMDAHLPDLRWLQSADIMYIFHHDVPIHKLSRYSNTDWRLALVESKGGPYRDMNTDPDLKMWVYIVNLATPPAPPVFQYRIGSNFDVFTPDMVGMQIKMETKIKANSDDMTLIDPDGGGPQTFMSDPIMPYGAFSVQTKGQWFGTLRVWKKDPGPDEEWEILKSFTRDAEEDSNFIFTYAVEEYGTEFRFEWEQKTGTTRNCSLIWDYDGGIINREFRITDWVTNRIVNVEPTDWIDGAVPLTADWAMGAFGAPFGYPAVGIFHQDRLCLANTKADPQTIWMSQPSSWEDFSTSIPTQDDDGITLTLASKQVNEIRGLASKADLLAFTSGGPWVVSAGTNRDVFTPSSIVARQSSTFGCAFVDPLDIGTSVFYVQRAKKKIRGIGYRLESDGYVSSDISILATHMTEDANILYWAFQQEPWSIAWMVLDNKTVISLTVQEDQQVQAWARHDFSGSVEDVQTIPGDGQDDVYFAVRRNGSIRLERMLKRQDKTVVAAMFMDGGSYPVKSWIELLDWEQPVNGTLQGQHKGMYTVTARVFRTCGFKVGVMNENNTLLDWARLGTDAPSVLAQPVSGDFRLEIPGGDAKQCFLRIEMPEPRPVTILAIYPEVNVDAR